MTKMPQKVEDNDTDETVAASIVQIREDERVRQMLDGVGENTCKRHYHGKLQSKYVVPRNSEAFLSSSSGITGLACATNRSLSLLAMDSLEYYQFAENLGVDVLSLKDKTAAFIVDVEDETQYVMDEPFNGNTLRNFITDFAESRLRRSLRSASPSSTDRHCEKGEVCIQEVTTQSFSKVVLDENKDVVLLHYSPYCVFCATVSHILLGVARHFADSANVTFARIDGDRNDLPWEYTVESFPTFMVFPAHRKSESRVFPHSLPVTFENLLNFVLANVGLETRIQVALKMCRGPCIVWGRRETLRTTRRLEAQRRSLLTRLRQVSSRLASGEATREGPQKETLKFYRRFLLKEIHRTFVRLRHTRRVGLVLSTAKDLDRTSAHYKVLVQSYYAYTHSLQVLERKDATQRNERTEERTNSVPKDEL